MRRHTIFATFFAGLLVAGCGDDSNGGSDAGLDAAGAADAGAADASTTDAQMLDAGGPADGGDVSDAGAETDAGGTADAGTADAGTGDAGAAQDAAAADGGAAARCVASGGTVGTALCCASAGDFPNLCLTGPCGCAPASSHSVMVCTCPGAMCFDATACTTP